MEVEDEFPALATVARPTPPSPAAHPSPSPIPSITTPVQTTVNKDDNCSQPHRPILNPVAPSKRAAQNSTDSMTQSASNETYQIPAYLPKELRDIIQKRQEQERAWHFRLSICVSVICNIESTLENYKGDIEKREADLIRGYLQQAIARLAASNNVPKPSPIPLKTKPLRSTIHKEGQDLERKKLSSGTSKSPTSQSILKPQKVVFEDYNKSAIEKSSWVTVARNGHKKSRIIASTPSVPSAKILDIQKNMPQASNLNQSHKKKVIVPISDSRLFVRLPINHEWRTLSLSGLREVIVKRLGVSPASIGLIKPTSSRLLNTGAKIEPASNWIPLLAPTVPKYISTLEGQIEVNKEMLAYEIERVTSIRPASVRLYGSSNQPAPHRTWMAFFTKAPRSGFRVFDESGKVTFFKKQKAIDLCKRCNGHHPSRNCSRAPSCGNCGSVMHTENDCKALTKCKNCGGPYRSDSHKCLARPTRSGGPTKEQLKIFRTVGEREYQAVARAKAAEQRALASEDNILISSSQSSEYSNLTNQQSPVEFSIGEQKRL
ncbi:putative eka-like protein [Erysiphe necator]|uniref:Putative eka-like protein n=1 Tax=Uncinula necator TaxID=52586 RepID=A0A0B1PEU4_UNCNE|nr:putative eka-like protein [Erysiphe necator]